MTECPSFSHRPIMPVGWGRSRTRVTSCGRSPLSRCACGRFRPASTSRRMMTPRLSSLSDRQQTRRRSTQPDKSCHGDPAASASTDNFIQGRPGRLNMTTDAIAVIRTLAERWPKTFFPEAKKRKPLKVGIFEDLKAAAPDINRKMLRLALRMYTTSGAYLFACIKGHKRVDLNGNAVEEVSEKDKARA